MRTHGMIAALEYRTRPRLDFPDIVEEFDIALATERDAMRRLTWDCDDIALIDRGALRVALGWLPPVQSGQPWYLVIAAGAVPGMPGGPDNPDRMARAVVARLQDYLPADSHFFSAAQQPVGADLLDMVFELLHLPQEETTTPRAIRPPLAPPGQTSLRGTPRPSPWSARPGQPAFHGARPASQSKREITLPQRLTIYTFGLTMMLHVPPLGAALLTYTMLRDAVPAAG